MADSGEQEMCPDVEFVEAVDGMEVDDAEYDDDDFEFDDLDQPPMPELLVDRIRASLAYNAVIRVSLEKINSDWEKKMRFSILEPCAECGVANHVDLEGVPEREDVCDLCKNKETFTRTVVYRIKIPIGVRHGTTVVLKNKGHIYDNRIQGNIVVTILDEPHEHFLRVNDDVIVCFQIDHTESKFGVRRILTPPGYPDSPAVVLQTAPGCEVSDNDIFLVKSLGLKIPTGILDECGEEKFDSGDLYVLFLVRPKSSVKPVKLKNLKLRKCSDCDTCDTTSDTFLNLNPADTLNLNGSPAGPRHEMKANGAGGRSPRKRRKNGEVEEHRKKIPRPEKVPSEYLHQQPPCVDPSKLSFLDRLVNHPGRIPLPFRDPVADEITIAELEPLWERQRYKSWWQRFESPRDCKLFPDSVNASGVNSSESSIFKGRTCPSCSKNTLFDLKDDSVDSGEEAIKRLLIGHVGVNPNHLKFALTSSLSRCKVLRLLKRAEEYLADPVVQGRM